MTIAAPNRTTAEAVPQLRKALDDAMAAAARTNMRGFTLFCATADGVDGDEFARELEELLRPYANRHPLIYCIDTGRSTCRRQAGVDVIVRTILQFL